MCCVTVSAVPCALHPMQADVRGAGADRRFGRLDVLFCNAGVLPSAGFRAAVVLRAMFGCSMAHFYETSRCALHRVLRVLRTPATSRRALAVVWCCRASPQGHAFIRNPPNEVTPEGFGRLFATHVLGHLLLVRTAKPLRTSASVTARDVAPRGRSTTCCRC